MHLLCIRNEENIMNILTEYIELSEEVKAALEGGKPVVAIETGGTFEGLAYPDCVETALEVHNKIRAMDVVPAYVSVMNGKIKVGMNESEIEEYSKRKSSMRKVSTRELPMILAKGMDGVMTIAATMMVADLVGILVVSGCGMGGVHRGAETSMDISADLEEIAIRNVVVVCSGAKSILDLSLTMEYLETKSITIMGYKTDELPAYMARSSGIKLPFRVDTLEEVSKAYRIKNELGIKSGMMLMNPIDEEYAVDADAMNKAIDDAVRLSKEEGITGKPITAYLMKYLKEAMGDDSEDTHKHLIIQDAVLAAELAKVI